jgi:hypothetical protein
MNPFVRARSISESKSLGQSRSISRATADNSNFQMPVEIRRLSGLNFAEMDCMRASWAAHI